MKKGRALGLIGLVLLVLVGLMGLKAPASYEEPPLGDLGRAIYDRESRLLFRSEPRYRVYRLRKEAPRLVAEGLDKKEAQRFFKTPGFSLERYWHSQYLAGEAFKDLLRAFQGRNFYPSLRLSLSWEVQEGLYRWLGRWREAFSELGAAVIEIPSGEVFALSHWPPERPSSLQHLLFPIPSGSKEFDVHFFGQATGLELKEELGSYWPGGPSWATPLQMARALAVKLCKVPVKFTLFSQDRALTGSCSRGEGPYQYLFQKKWVEFRLWPKEQPRFIFILAGELKANPPSISDWALVERSLLRYLPQPRGREAFPGFPDLRGLTLKAALEELRGRDLKIRFQGFGTVVRQHPSPGTPWKKIKECVLYLKDET